MTAILNASDLPSASGESSQTSPDASGPQPPASDHNGDEPAGARSGRRRAVLVVDDEPAVRLLVTEVLHDLEYTSLEAVDGASGLQILKSDEPIDLLITDVGLPGGMDGRSLAAAARGERPGLAVLFITGYAETSPPGDGPLEPGMKMLRKPFSIDVLTSHVRELTA